VADEKANEEAFGRPGASRGSSAYPETRKQALTKLEAFRNKIGIPISGGIIWR
jgi:hypothetical protein